MELWNYGLCSLSEIQQKACQEGGKEKINWAPKYNHFSKFSWLFDIRSLRSAHLKSNIYNPIM